ncbi:MAG: KH domain-containing protein [bacterium]|nr:MAG: KH domain-containing protein [bacterium]
MKDLLDFIIKNILSKDSKYEIIEDDNGSVVTLTVKTSDEDGGMVIGKQGKIIKAIRNLLRIKATLEKKKIILLVNPTN